jgi:RNA polymerase-binding transcription factor DksA
MMSAREKLEAALQAAEKELQELNKQLEHRPDFGLGKGNAGAYWWEMALAHRDWVTARIKALQEALSREREGTYGRCDLCGVQITPERLEILPATTLCAACARETNAALPITPRSRAPADVQE